MKGRAFLGSTVASLSILAIGWQIGVQPSVVQAGSSTTVSPVASTETSTETSTEISADTSTTTSYTGEPVSHEYGSVTVTITVTDGALTDATAELSTTHNKSESINARALPLLREEVLEAQSADVSMISGATYTSEAYLTSLQSALDQAGLS